MVLPAPVGPDDGDGLAGLDDQVEVVDERHVGHVAEGDVVEDDLAGGRARGRWGCGDVRDLLRLVEQLEDALGRGHRGLEHVERCWPSG